MTSVGLVLPWFLQLRSIQFAVSLFPVLSTITFGNSLFSTNALLFWYLHESYWFGVTMVSAVPFHLVSDLLASCLITPCFLLMPLCFDISTTHIGVVLPWFPQLRPAWFLLSWFLLGFLCCLHFEFESPSFLLLPSPCFWCQLTVGWVSPCLVGRHSYLIHWKYSL